MTEQLETIERVEIEAAPPMIHLVDQARSTGDVIVALCGKVLRRHGLYGVGTDCVVCEGLSQQQL